MLTILLGLLLVSVIGTTFESVLSFVVGVVTGSIFMLLVIYYAFEPFDDESEGYE